VQGVQAHPVSFDVSRIWEKSLKIWAKALKIWAKSLPIRAKMAPNVV